jgi:hypothetical protein
LFKAKEFGRFSSCYKNYQISIGFNFLNPLSIAEHTHAIIFKNRYRSQLQIFSERRKKRVSIVFVFGSIFFTFTIITTPAMETDHIGTMLLF